jgi:hypothetical protein
MARRLGATTFQVAASAWLSDDASPFPLSPVLLEPANRLLPVRARVKPTARGVWGSL